ncbi:MAG: glycosyltransferase family 2 protein [candidate division KSB1 bacterium]|nr:glycosyltransferase family 2 protein [candidate division KSB1 bacterium]
MTASDTTSATRAGAATEPVSEPRVFILLVNWNGKADTLACLESLQQVNYANKTIVVVDNGSSDGSVEAIRRRFPEVRLIRNEHNERFARANNQSMQLALQEGADYVLLLNNDTLVDAEFLRHLVNRAESDPAIGMVGGKIYYAEPADRLWFVGGGVDLWRGRIWHHGLRQEDRGQFDQPRDVDYITGCCVLVRRACIETIGLLDESYYIYGEDVDWSFRARQAGFRLVYEPKAKIWHKISSSSGGPRTPEGLTGFKVFHKVRSMLKFFWKHARWYHWLTIPVFMTIEAMRVVFWLAIRGNWQAIRALVRAVLPSRSQSNDAGG